MSSRNDHNFIAFCDELRAYVMEHHLFPAKHNTLLNKCKYVRRKIKDGTLEEWKKDMFLEIANMRDLTLHTGGRKRFVTEEHDSDECGEG